MFVYMSVPQNQSQLSNINILWMSNRDWGLVSHDSIKINVSVMFILLTNTQVLTTCHSRDPGRQQGRWDDSYAQHSVAPKLQLPPGAPTRLQVEAEPEEDDLHPPLSDSYTSSPDAQGRRFIKRKVLRWLTVVAFITNAFKTFDADL